MLADVEWSNLTVAGAFVLGATLATIATLRVVRAVATLFTDSRPRRRPLQPPPEEDEPE